MFVNTPVLHENLRRFVVTARGAEEIIEDRLHKAISMSGRGKSLVFPTALTRPYKDNRAIA